MIKYILIGMLSLVFACASWTPAQKVAACNGFGELAKLESVRFKSEEAATRFVSGISAAQRTCVSVINEDPATACGLFSEVLPVCDEFNNENDVGSCQRLLIAGKVICDIQTAEEVEETPEELVAPEDE